MPVYGFGAYAGMTNTGDFFKGFFDGRADGKEAGTDGG